MKDLYEVLEVERSATKDEIKTSYRKLAKKYHPDLNGGDLEYQEKFKEITAAYEVLSNDDKRQKYDMYGTSDFSSQGMGMNMNFEDIFGDIFDIFSGGMGYGRSTPNVVIGEDRRVDVELDLKDTLYDIEREISYKRLVICDKCHGKGAKESDIETCPECKGRGRVRVLRDSLFGRIEQVTTCKTCGGSGNRINVPCSECDGKKRVVKEEKRTVTIRRGIKDNNVINLGSHGDKGLNGGLDGNLYLVIHVNNDSNYKIEGNDLIKNLHITFPEAALGTRKVITTLDSEEEIIIPEGAETGGVITINKKGLYSYNSNRRGNLYLILNVKTPKNLTEKQKELLREFAADEDINEPPPYMSFISRIKMKIGKFIKNIIKRI